MSPVPDDATAHETLDLGTGPDPREDPSCGTHTLGRYVVLGTLGSGGMGVVLRAYDPELERVVALKLLHVTLRLGSSGVRAEARLIREARAMAQVSHPNVIRVFDVGHIGASVFLAMELVEGETLRQWQAGARSWREIVETYLQAGRGLAAAHAEGLVHRDFKPSNVLVDTDGEGWRVRVLDFGLARTSAETNEPSDESSDEPGAPHSHDPLTSRLTEAGTVMGTPAYMAPEQASGSAVPASDQYAFCVALYEALHGLRPFSGDADELLAAKRRGAIVERPRPRGVPRAIVRAIARGLAPEPSARFASIDALLLVLTHALRRRRWPLLVGAGTVAAVVAGALVGGGTSRCESGEDRIAEVYGAERREAMRTAIAGTAASYAEAVAEHVTEALDEHGRRWVAEHRRLCDAAAAAELDAGALDRGMGCLSRRLVELDTVLAVLAEAGPRNAARVVDGLGDPADCPASDGLVAAAQRPLEPGAAARYDAALDANHRAAVMLDAGDPERALSLAQQTLAAADELDHPGLRVAGLYRAAVAQLALADYDGAVRSLDEGFFLAQEIHDDVRAADDAIKLAFVAAFHLAKPEDARLWIRHAEVAIGRLAEPAEASARLEGVRGTLAAHEHDYALALVHHEKTLEIWSSLYSEENDAIALGHHNIGTVLARLGRNDEAADRYARALAIREGMLGANHPDLGETRNNLGVLLTAQGRYAEARAELERAAAIFGETLGSEHPTTASVLVNLGDIDLAEQRWADALDKNTRAHGMFVAALDPDHFYVAYPLTGMGLAAVELGRFDEARASLTRALEIRGGGPQDDPTLADSRFALARALHGLGRASSEWVPHADAALAVWRARTDDDNAAARVAAIRALLDRTPRDP